MIEALTFDDILIVPQFSKIASRKDVDLSVSTSKKIFYDIHANFPVISANMDTVTGPAMAKAMLGYGAQACLHRFCTIEENVKMLQESEYTIEPECYVRPMVSIGLGDKELDRASALYYNNATYFVIDVAHGAQLAVANQVKALREIIKDNGAIIVGNFASTDSVRDFLLCAGNVEGIKVGVGPGASCKTRVQTGVGYPQFSAILEISKFLKNWGIPVIADGGLKTPGDIAKALGAGAHFVMLGSMLAGTDESPGELTNSSGNPMTFLNDGLVKVDEWVSHRSNVKPFKKYRGSASKESYEAQGKTGTHRTAEGESFLVPYKGPVASVLQEIEGGLRSAMTYVGASNLDEFRAKVEFVRVTNAGYIEGTPHGKK